MEWIKKGALEDVAAFYGSAAPGLDESVIARRKAVLGDVDPAAVIFESGGTFGFLASQPEGVLYADRVSQLIKDSGRPSLNVVVIDPTDIARRERTFTVAGKKFKIPLPEAVSDNTSTAAVRPPEKDSIDALVGEIAAAKPEEAAFFEDVLYSAFSKSKTFRDFTESLLVAMLSRYTKNSRFITLKKWQSQWDFSICTDEDEFRVDDGKTISLINGKPKGDAVFIPQGGLLYMFDIVTYGAIPVAPEEERVKQGWLRANELTKKTNLPVLCESP